MMNKWCINLSPLTVVLRNVMREFLDYPLSQNVERKNTKEKKSKAGRRKMRKKSTIYTGL